MPIPLLLCAEYLYSNRPNHESFTARLQELLDIFRQLKNVIDPTKSYMHLLKMSSTPMSAYLTEENLYSGL